jgi:hypothetical protein
MYTEEQLKKDLVTLSIETWDNLSIRFVTLKYKRLAKERHPDREGGNKGEFQDLQNAYKRVIAYLEDAMDVEESDIDFEKEFFMKHNIMKECTSSFVVYIQECLVTNWKNVFHRHLTFHKMDKVQIIFKDSNITITLYEKPKKDPRSKLHIQSNDQRKNLEFIMENLASFYKEVCAMDPNFMQVMKPKLMEKAQCPQCGKHFTKKESNSIL